MKVGRRGFLGLMAGGAVSAPTLAKGLADEAAAGGFGKISTVGSAPLKTAWGIGSDDADDSWKLSRIAELKQWISGGRPDDEHRRQQRALYELETKERYRLDTLRSVSTSHRFAMFTEGNARREEALNRLKWERELSQLTGGLL